MRNGVSSKAQVQCHMLLKDERVEEVVTVEGTLLEARDVMVFLSCHSICNEYADVLK